MIPTDLDPQIGDNIWQRWVHLVTYLRTRERRITGPGIRTTESEGGHTVVAVRPLPPTGKFYVAASGSEAVIKPGTVNLLSPRLRDGGDLIPMDGLMPDGTYREPPSLIFEEDSVGEDNRSFIVIRIKLDPSKGALDPKDDEALVIEHRPTLLRGKDEILDPEYDEGGVTYYPLAVLYWSAPGVLSGVGQYVFHDLYHRYYPGKEGRPGRHVVRPGP